MFYNENVYCLLSSSTNPVFGKNLFPELWPKMLSANQIASFLNELFLQSKLVKNLIFSMLIQIHLHGQKNGYDQSGLWTLKFTVSQE